MDCNEYGRLKEPEFALVEGYLREVNPELGTAKVCDGVNGGVPLRFDSSLKQTMIRLETRFVRVRGKGWINDADEWIAVNADDIAGPADKPFDPDEYYNNPNPKVFDPDKIVRAREPFDVDQFLQDIYKARGRQC